MKNYKQIPILKKGYLISKQGYVYSEISSIVMKQYEEKAGYMSIKISGINYSVHRLMAATYLNHNKRGYNTVVDHINGVKNDNRLENLRIISNRENVSKERNTKSKYPGVSPMNGGFMSQIRIKGKLKYLGTFDTEQLAYGAYIHELSYLSE